jgi:N-acetylglucosaminyldiphosphoundecaprenol N-acetyl-beta-D-mannosaminyltransferase
VNGVPRIDLLGCPFDVISLDDTIEAIRQTVRANGRLQIVPGSIDFVIKARRDPQFAADLRRADLVVADGVPIVWSASLLRTGLRGRVSGTEVAWQCAAVSAETTAPIALIGARPDVAERAAQRMMESHPGARVIPIRTPCPLRHEESLKAAGHVRDVGARIVLVALGAPRQERWICTYLDLTGANVGIGIGSAFDIISGDKPRAPAWMQRAGLEWFHRMLLEPKRLGRRYLIEDSPYVLLLLRALIFDRLRGHRV